MICDFVAEEASDAVDGVGGSGQFVCQFFIVPECEVHARVGEGDASELVDDVAEFGGRFFEESSASRCVEEEVVNFHDGSGRAAAVTIDDDLAPMTFQFTSDFIFVWPRAYAEP